MKKNTMNQVEKKEKKEEQMSNLYYLEKDQLYIHGVTKLKESQLLVKDGRKTEGLETRHKRLNDKLVSKTDDMSMMKRKK